jgi:hypothetical protein
MPAECDQNAREIEDQDQAISDPITGSLPVAATWGNPALHRQDCQTGYGVTVSV